MNITTHDNQVPYRSVCFLKHFSIKYVNILQNW